MTFRITRHVKVIVPEAFRAKEKPVDAIDDSGSKGLKRVLEKSLVLFPVVSVGSTAAVAGFAQTNLAFLGAPNILGLFILTMATSATSLMVVPSMIRHSIDNGTNRYWPGKPKPQYVAKQNFLLPTIEPFAEWDNVFLPFAVEAFNGVSVTDEAGNQRKPIRLHTDNYVELRTEARKQGINYSLVEAQKIT